MMALLATLIVTTLAFPGVCAVEADNTGDNGRKTTMECHEKSKVINFVYLFAQMLQAAASIPVISPSKAGICPAPTRLLFYPSWKQPHRKLYIRGS